MERFGTMWCGRLAAPGHSLDSLYRLRPVPRRKQDPFGVGTHEVRLIRVLFAR